LAQLIEEVDSYNGKTLFVTLPDIVSAKHEAELKVAGFKDIGSLGDYYSAGVDEVWWSRRFD